MPEIHGSASFPGVVGVMRCSYTSSHGTSPGVCQMTIYPQPSLPAQYGDVTMTDGINAFTLTKCRLNTVRVSLGPRGFEWDLEIVDRRWQWKNFGKIDGWYNQLDPNGKLIPRYIRSPSELAILCLQAMGEVNYLIDMPYGLTSEDGKQFADQLRVGELLPQTSTNPPISWRGEAPMNALSRLCDMFGRRVVYDPIRDIVIISKVGVGADLPDGHIATDGPSLRSPEIPDRLTVYGDPTRYQVRLPVEPVGREWNGELRPIDMLSYAPTWVAKLHRVTVTVTLPAGLPADLQYSMGMTFWDRNNNVHTATGTDASVASSGTATDVLNTVKSYLLLSNPLLPNLVNITVASGVMTLEAKTPDVNFTVDYNQFVGTVDDPEIEAESVMAITQVGRLAGKGWQYSDPYMLANVTPTDRLSLEQARDLAKESVWKMYQVTGVDATGIGPVNVPGYGRIQFLQQLLLTPSKVDQIVPTLGDDRIITQLNEPYIRNFYNGYSKDMPATAYGSVYRGGALAKFNFLAATTGNTPDGTEILIPYSVDPGFFCVTFSAPVFKQAAGQYHKPQILLEMAVMVRDPNTYQLESYQASRELVNGVPTGTQARIYRHSDVQLNVTAAYRNDGTFTPQLLEIDPVARAEYYLDAHSLEYFLAKGHTRTYNGLVPINMDGAVCQVTYEIGESGVNTKASRNTEHMIWAPDYPTRRRAENLDAMQRKSGVHFRFKSAPAGTTTEFVYRLADDPL